MATKGIAVRSARHSLKQHGRPMFIYRVGAEWMFTSESLENAQKRYKVKLQEYQQVKLDWQA